jgi:hypothetical protein
MGGMHEKPHQREIPEQGDKAIRKVEAPKLLRPGCCVAAVAPGEVLVPEEVMQQGQLHRCGGGPQIMPAHPAIEESQCGELHRHPHRADEVESQPAQDAALIEGCSEAHGSGYSR